MSVEHALRHIASGQRRQNHRGGDQRPFKSTNTIGSLNSRLVFAMIFAGRQHGPRGLIAVRHRKGCADEQPHHIIAGHDHSTRHGRVTVPKKSGKSACTVNGLVRGRSSALHISGLGGTAVTTFKGVSGSGRCVRTPFHQSCRVASRRTITLTAGQMA